MTPAFIQNKIGTLLEKLGQYIQTGGKYLSSASSLKSYYSNYKVHTLEEVKLVPIIEMDQVVSMLAKNRENGQRYKARVQGVKGYLDYPSTFH